MINKKTSQRTPWKKKSKMWYIVKKKLMFYPQKINIIKMSFSIKRKLQRYQSKRMPETLLIEFWIFKKVQTYFWDNKAYFNMNQILDAIMK